MSLISRRRPAAAARRHATVYHVSRAPPSACAGIAKTACYCLQAAACTSVPLQGAKEATQRTSPGAKRGACRTAVACAVGRAPRILRGRRTDSADGRASLTPVRGLTTAASASASAATSTERHSKGRSGEAKRVVATSRLSAPRRSCLHPTVTFYSCRDYRKFQHQTCTLGSGNTHTLWSD